MPPSNFKSQFMSSLQDARYSPLPYLGLRPRLSYFGPPDLFGGTIATLLKDVGNGKALTSDIEGKRNYKRLCDDRR